MFHMCLAPIIRFSRTVLNSCIAFHGTR
jgi:hypothetical protein